MLVLRLFNTNQTAVVRGYFLIWADKTIAIADIPTKLGNHTKNRRIQPHSG
jgi:hypothetical protein